MGFVGGLLGLNGGVNGTGISGPESANLVNPTNSDQLKTGYGQVQGGLGTQNDLLAALQGQQGLQNQSNVYNQLQGVAQGNGPNPAKAMLNQATAQNVQNQAALMAGQRGAASNVGLMARQAAQQGANTQQQAVGQGATMQANQSLGALGQMGQMANTQAGQQIGQTNANLAARQAAQNSLLGAQANYNSAQAGMQGNINSANAGLAGQTMQQQGQVFGGAMQAGAAAMADGGEVAYPGQSKFGQFLSQNEQVAAPQMTPISMPQSNDDTLQKGTAALGKAAFNSKAAPTPDPFNSNYAPNVGSLPEAGTPGMHLSNFAGGGKVPAMVSPGEKYLTPAAVKKVAKGANPMQVGETIPGKPKVGGAKNSYANDTVPKTLEEGGIVIPRSVTQSKHPHWAAHRFVSAILAKNGKMK